MAHIPTKNEKIKTKRKLYRRTCAHFDGNEDHPILVAYNCLVPVPN